MKLLLAPVVVVVGLLMSFSVLFATGDPPSVGCASTGQLDVVLATVRTRESGGDYTARARGSTASGAYQFVDATWANYGGYPRAWQAPRVVQDQEAAEHVQAILNGHDGDVTAVPVVWYIGHLPTPDSAEWDAVPAPGSGNVLTARQYQRHWLDEYQRQLAVTGGRDQDPGAAAACVPAAPIGALADGYAYPGPADLFSTAPVDAPHHDYPAWDWGIPVGTPIYAVRRGRVASVQYWPHNWWDHGCGHNSASCQPCGIGVTIEDDRGNRWDYCHASNVHVQTGDTVAAGTQILTSGNTGRSSGPHLHLQVRTLDERLRCPQPLLRSLRDHATGIDPATLPTTGCSY